MLPRILGFQILDEIFHSDWMKIMGQGLLQLWPGPGFNFSLKSERTLAGIRFPVVFILVWNQNWN
jgi:hypothetical protein